MIIRKAKIDEIKTILALYTQIMVNNTSYDPDAIPDIAHTKQGKKYFRDAINRKDRFFLVAVEHDALIGYVNGGPMDIFYRKSKYIEIENLGVLPEYQGKGIGSQLLESAEEWARKKGFDKVYVNSYVENHQAIEFYKHMNYSEIDVSLEKSIT